MAKPLTADTLVQSSQYQELIRQSLLKAKNPSAAHDDSFHRFIAHFNIIPPSDYAALPCLTHHPDLISNSGTVIVFAMDKSAFFRSLIAHPLCPAKISETAVKDACKKLHFIMLAKMAKGSDTPSTMLYSEANTFHRNHCAKRRKKNKAADSIALSDCLSTALDDSGFGDMAELAQTLDNFDVEEACSTYPKPIDTEQVWLERHNEIWEELQSLKLKFAQHALQQNRRYGFSCHMASVTCKVAVVGRTGDGKSTLSNSIARRLGMEHEPFSESSSALSHTHAVLRCQIDELELYDTPGLMDSGGVKQDETNIRSIVQELRGGSYVNAFLLVINEQAPRFDAGMQDAVKLIVDSFGPECLSHMGFVFTKALGGVSPEDARLTAGQFASVISNRTHVPVAHMPAWQIDCHPERLAALGVPLERIAERSESAGIALDEMMRWAHAKPRFSTIGAEAAAYDEISLGDMEFALSDQSISNLPGHTFSSSTPANAH